MTAEARAEMHSAACAPVCPMCLSRDLKAKADAVRHACAKLAEAMAQGEETCGRKSTAAILRQLAEKVRRAP